MCSVHEPSLERATESLQLTFVLGPQCLQQRGAPKRLNLVSLPNTVGFGKARGKLTRGQWRGAGRREASLLCSSSLGVSSVLFLRRIYLKWALLARALGQAVLLCQCAQQRRRRQHRRKWPLCSGLGWLQCRSRWRCNRPHSCPLPHSNEFIQQRRQITQLPASP